MLTPATPHPHFSQEDLESYLAEKFDLERTVRFRSHFLTCPACEGRLLEAVSKRLASSAATVKFQRREPRIPRNGSGLLQPLSPLSFEKLPAVIEDVSQKGYGLCLPVPLEPGVIVSIEIEGLFSVGVVRSCLNTGTESFRLGIELHAAPKPVATPRIH